MQNTHRLLYILTTVNNSNFNCFHFCIMWTSNFQVEVKGTGHFKENICKPLDLRTTLELFSC